MDADFTSLTLEHELVAAALEAAARKRRLPLKLLDLER